MAETIFTVLLILLLVMSVYHDYRTQKIPNKITIPAIAAGVILSTVYFGFSGLWSSLLGFIVGFLIFFLPFILGGMGAGDVKLMAAIGAVMGARFVFMTFIYTAIVGGIIALGYGIYKRGLGTSLKLFGNFLISPLLKFLYRLTGYHKFIEWYGLLKKSETRTGKLYIPYAIPIAIGAALVYTNWIPSFF